MGKKRGKKNRETEALRLAILAGVLQVIAMLIELAAIIIDKLTR